MKYTIDNAAYFQGAAAALILYLVISSFLTYRRLRHFPGPFLASFSYASIFLFWFSRKQSASYKDLHKKYNSRLVRIGPNDLITDDPEMIKRMNSARSKYGRSDWYKPTKINPYEDALFNLMDVKEHDVLKAKLSFGYGGKENPDLEAGIDEQLSALVSLIRQKYITVGSALRPIEFGTTTQRFTLDVITRVAYGKAFGYLRPEEEDVYNYLQATNTGPRKYLGGGGLYTDLMNYRMISDLIHTLQNSHPNARSFRRNPMGGEAALLEVFSESYWAETNG